MGAGHGRWLQAVALRERLHGRPAAMTPAERIARALGGARRSGNGWLCLCPAHDDHNPSLSVTDGDDGKVLVYCHGGCSQEAVIGELRHQGLWPANGTASEASPKPHAKRKAWTLILPVPEDAPRQIPAHPLHGKPSARWLYKDAQGRLLGLVCRFDHEDGSKDFAPLTYCQGPDGRREWRWQGFSEPRPLYGLDRLAERPDAPVVIPEGEKAADAAQDLFPDHVAITWPHGAKSVSRTDWRPVQGRRATTWPDADPEGQEATKAAARACLDAGAAEVRTVELPQGFPAKKGWDLADDPPQGWDIERLRGLLDAATPFSPEDHLGTDTESSQATVERLAVIPPLEYDHRRQAEAKRLKVRVTTLDEAVKRAGRSTAAGEGKQGRPIKLSEPEPWHEPVDGARMLDDLVAAFRRYLILPEGAAETFALWTVHTHAFDAANYTPRLIINSPTPQCGKSRGLDVFKRLVFRPLRADSITSAIVYRAIEACSPTLLVDEFDAYGKDDEQLRGIIDSGHCRGGSVIRAVGDDHVPRQFNTFAPMAIACIGQVASTIQDRGINFSMQRRASGERIERFRADRTPDLDFLARHVARWAQDNVAALKDADPDVPAELNDRDADHWRPLFAIADQAGDAWPERARTAARVLTARDSDSETIRILLLADLRDLFAERNADKLASAEIIEALTSKEDRPWPEWRNGKPLTTRQLATLLKPFGIKPKNIRLDDDRTPKGYDLAGFADAFSRYPPPQSATAPQSKETVGLSEFSSATSEEGVADRKGVKVAENLTCGGVADKKGDPKGDDDLRDIPGFLRRVPEPRSNDDEVCE